MRTFLLAVAAALFIATPAEAAPQWLAPVDLGAETATTSSIGRIALGADGTAVAAWAQFDPGSANWVLQVSRRKPGEGFGGPITVPNTPGAGGVRVGVDGAGNATILYEAGGALVLVPWPAASAEPGAKQPLEAGGFGELAVGRNGTAVATWIQNPAAMATAHVRAAVRPGPSGDFGAPATISADGDDATTPTITGLRAAVGDGGHATVVWSRNTLTPNLTVVEANMLAPGGSFSTTGETVSSAIAPALENEPAVAVDAAGRATVLFTYAGLVRYTERAPGDPFWATPQPISPTGPASMPAVAAAPGGAVIAAWLSGTAIVSAARPAGGGAFGSPQTISGPGMSPSLPIVAVGGNGDALISWSLGDQKSIPTVQRKANGTFGPLLVAVTAANQPPGEEQNFFQPSIGIDDEGNGVAAWTRDAFRNPTSFYRFQGASFDAAAPALNASVPPGGTVGGGIGMAAAASDRVSPVGIAWAFGDGTTGAGGAVTHAFGSAGAFNVTVTATDAAGNATSQTHPVLVAAARKRRIDSSVSTRWAFNKRRVFLLRMRVNAPPRRAKAELRCGGKKCPFKRRKVGKIRKNALTVFKNMKATKAVNKKIRRFRPKQTLQLRITAPGFTGKVVKYRIKKGKIPVGKVLCLPEGKKKPRKCGR